MDWHILPSRDGWMLRKNGSGRSAAKFHLRREAINEAKAQASKTKGIIYVHNSSGDVVIRIPELDRVAASVHIYDAPEMTVNGRKEIAAWLHKHANWLMKDGDNYAKRFRGRYFCAK